MEGPHAPSLSATATDAVEYLMTHGQAARRQIQFISRSDEMRRWLHAGTAKGHLSLRQQAFLHQCIVDCSALDAPAARKSRFIAVNRVFWALTPQLKESLLVDCNTCSLARKHAIARIEGLLGTSWPELALAESHSRTIRKRWMSA